MLVWNNSPSLPESNKVVLPPLIPPFRFHIVEGSNRNEALYRSAYPTERNFRFLRRLRLKTIISLVPRNLMTPSLQSFCLSENIAHVSFPASATQKPLDASQDDPNAPAPTHSLCAQVLTMCIDRERLPLLIHCTNGAHVTGLIIALLRKLQHHTSDSYLEEFVRFTKNHTLDEDERHFIARYFSAVTLPGSLPSWLWGGERPTRHPTLPLFAAAVSVGLSPDDFEADKDFSPPPVPATQPSVSRDGDMGSSHHHHHMNLIRVKSGETASAELLSMLTQDEAALDGDGQTDSANEGLRGMSVEEPSSVMRRRTTS